MSGESDTMKPIVLQGSLLGGGFKHFLFSPRNAGEMIRFDDHIVQMGWNHQLD